jgi:hypothetical protein
MSYITKQGISQERSLQDKYGSLPSIKNMAELIVTKFEAIRWVIFGLLPEGLAILSGPPKIGKSWLVMNLCIAKAIGGFVLGMFKVEASEVLLLSLEDNERRLQDRLIKCLNGIKHNLSKFHAVTTWRRLDQGGLDDLAQWLEYHPECSLVVIDTIQKIKPHGRKNANAYESDYSIYGDLQRLALKFCCCILVIHHNRKSDSKNNDDPLEQISGSTGITGSMDTILMLKRPRGATGAVLTATGRDIPEAEFAMTFDGSIGQWVIFGKAAELSMGDNSHSILDVLKAQSGHGLTVEEVNCLLSEQMDAPYLKTKLYRMVSKGILSVNRGKFMYINTDTSDTERY